MTRNKTGAADRMPAEAAFTLTEVMVAVVLMLLSLGLLLSAFVNSKSNIAAAQNYITALQIAGSEAEQLQTNSYTSIGNITNASITNTLIDCRMNRSVVTNNLDKYRDITIIIEWTPASSSRRQAVTNYITICNTN